MEYVNRTKMSLALYPKLLEAKKAGMAQNLIENVIQSSAEGYPFPSNLDLDHPSPDDVAPRSQARYMLMALNEEWSFEKIEQELIDLEKRRH